MKKKKLKQRITELESKLGQEKSRSEAWKDISHRFISELKERGIKVSIILPERPVVEVSRTEDDVAKYAFRINTAPPTLSFDFTEHDKNAICDFKEKCKEDANGICPIISNIFDVLLS